MNQVRQKYNYRVVFEYILYTLVIFIYPFLFIRYGMDYTDGPFHMMSYVGLRNPTWMTGLQTYIGTMWMRLTGDFVLSYRILTRILVWFAMVVPTLVVVGWRKSKLNTLRCLSLSIILFSNLYMNNLSWDTLSYFFIAMIYSLTVAFILHDKSIWLVLIGILTGVLSLIRFPSLSIILPLLVMIYLKRKEANRKLEKISSDFLIMVVPMILTYAFLFIWLHKQYPLSLADSNGTESLGILTAIAEIIKSLVPLGYKYVNESMRVFEILGIITMMTLLWLRRKKLSKMRPWLIVSMVIVLSIYFVLTLLRSPYGRHLFLFLATIVLVLLGNSILQSKVKGDHKSLIILLFSLLIGPVSVIGSDTGLFRLFMGYSFVMPIALIYASRDLGCDMRKGLTILLCMAAVFSILNKVFFNTVFDDGKLMQLNSEINHPKMKGIKTMEVRKRHIESILAVADSIQHVDPDAEVLYYGTSSHLMSYLTNTKRPDSYGWLMDFQETKNLEDHLGSEEAPDYVFCITGYPERDKNYDISGVGQLLRDNNYIEIDEGNKYFVYMKCKEENTLKSRED